MSITIKTKKKEIQITSRSYLTKKFQGLGILFDCDVAQGFRHHTVLVINIKILFFGCWLDIGVEKIKPKFEVTFNIDQLNTAVNRMLSVLSDRKGF